jgi:hypothetical protein
MSKTDDPVFGQFDWAAVCDCGWAASSTGTTFGRHRIEHIGINHDRQCDDEVTLERRGEQSDEIKKLTSGWGDDSND